MTNDKIRDYVEEFVLYGDKLESDDASLVESGMIDSTGVMELVAFIEEEFKLDVPTADINPDNFDTVNKAAALVDRMLAPSAAA